MHNMNVGTLIKYSVTLRRFSKNYETHPLEASMKTSDENN